MAGTGKGAAKLPAGVTYLRDKDLYQARQSVSGKRIAKYGTTPEAALQALRAAVVERQGQTAAAAASGLTVDEYLTGWLERQRPEQRHETAAAYASYLTHVRASDIGDIRLRSLTSRDVSRLIGWLRRRTSAKTHRPLHQTTVANVHKVLRSALQDAVRDGIIDVNVADADRLSVSVAPLHREPTPLTLDEKSELRRLIAGHPYEVLFLLLLKTGLRPAEALALRWQYVDLDRRKVLEVRGSQVDSGEKRARDGKLKHRVLDIAEPKTTAGKRVVPIAEELVDALRALKASGALTSHDKRFPDLVFPSVGNGLMGQEVLSRWWRALVDGTPLAAHRLYDLRATYVSDLFDDGVAEHDIISVVGHSNLIVTLRHYAKSRNFDAVRRAING
ncbi:MAG: site-specific integrase [Candidatus Dormibacteraeota bacterium]|nr:site-specific integrase [Candidatus Dormibacteraeota bacterium]